MVCELYIQLDGNDANPAVKASYSDFGIMVILSAVTILLPRELRGQKLGHFGPQCWTAFKGRTKN